MDVSTAIQLDRLEELERAMLELDPSRFKPYDPGSVSAAGARFTGDDHDDDAAAAADVDDASTAEKASTDDDVGDDRSDSEIDMPPEGPVSESVGHAPSLPSADSKESLNGSSASAEEAAVPASAPFAPPRA